MAGEVWALADHACRHCFGRVLARMGEDGVQVFRCSNCGAEGREKVKTVCCCGMTLRSGKSAGLRCVINNNKTAALPSEVVAVSGV